MCFYLMFIFYRRFWFFYDGFVFLFMEVVFYKGIYLIYDLSFLFYFIENIYLVF